MHLPLGPALHLGRSVSPPRCLYPDCALEQVFPEESCAVTDLCPAFSTDAPPLLPPGTGTGISDDDDAPPASGTTSSPSDGSGQRGGGGEEADLCLIRETACVADETCEACMAGARLDGSCDRNATDCAGVAAFYCCVAGEGCSDNALLLDFVSESVVLRSCFSGLWRDAIAQVYRGNAPSP